MRAHIIGGHRSSLNVRMRGLAVTSILLWISSYAHAAQGITVQKLLLKGGSKLVLLSKDPGISIVGSDPVGGADSSVSFALGSQPLGDCPAMDCNGTGPVTIDCVVAAIGAALDGCYAAP